jgi:phosphonate transport system permease protein
VVGVGLGPTAGVLALAVGYGGTLGRVLADLFETVDPRPLEALHATGASRLQLLLYGILPQALPAAVAYALYSFECCVRAAIVLGIVGAGGLGYEIALSMRMFEYGEIATLLLALLALVWLTDAASRALRWTLRADLPGARRPESRRATGITRRGLVAIAVGLAIASAAAVGLFDPATYDAGMFGRMAEFARGFTPPDLSADFLASLVTPIAQTLAISVVGTAIGVAIGGVLAIPAATLHSEDDPARWARRLVGAFARGVLSWLRAIPEVIWVLIFLLAVGVGPFAGTLALGVHTGGVLGKLYADTLEEVSPLPLHGLRATGASSLQLLLWGAWPQARRMLVSYSLLRWEMNLRNSTVVGIAGGGGIGMALYNDVQLGFYPRVATMILVVAALVIATGALGDALLRRLESASLATRPQR